ncbi:MAG: ATP-binding protein [Candidatus Zixiibacteriota bacterium]|nr:MAG: ATP-binding protein [candidate division Zixibacteria bacterium]
MNPIEAFTLALSILPAIDHSCEPVVAAIMNDSSSVLPTLGLIQKLWDDNGNVLSLGDPAHKLVRFGLIAAQTGDTVWERPLVCPLPVVASLLMTDTSSEALQFVRGNDVNLTIEMRYAAARIGTGSLERGIIIPLIGRDGSPFADFAAGMGREMGRPVYRLRSRPPRGGAVDQWLAPWVARSWLDNSILFIGPDIFEADIPPIQVGAPAVIIVARTEHSTAVRFLDTEVATSLKAPRSNYVQRLQWWKEGLRVGEDDQQALSIIADCARRFRYERETIARLIDECRHLDRPLEEKELLTICRRDLRLGDLAEPVTPRFELKELILPRKQKRQIDEVIRAMRNLTRVHYDWGTAGPWAESGLSALFAGPPGTGKTMAAEVIAKDLKLPLYRIDLSQVVNKYIGETEKNLRRLFDAADASDVILFFDEADSLFGKRTEVRDAHDRYANLEISYLLERMERFKGLAILATNRKNDLDVAFLRRLRFIIDFPLPGPKERELIWKGCIPEDTEADLEFPFLARQFQLSGGNIKSVIFNACLQAAERGAKQELRMPQVIAAVAREFDKMDRSISLELYGPWVRALGEPDET